MALAIAFTSAALEQLRPLLVHLIALVLTLCGYRPTRRTAPAQPAPIAPVFIATIEPLEQLPYRAARRLCHQHGIRPGRSTASANAALLAAGLL